MKRRICLTTAGLVVGSLTLGVSIAPAAHTTQGSTHPAPVSVTCVTSVTAAIPAGATDLDPTATSGTEYGPVKCGGKRFGRGVYSDTFTVMDTGDNVGSYTEYLGRGSIRGLFDLTPSEAPAPSATTFTAATYTGTVTVTGGTGAYLGARGAGTSQCVSPDSIHTSCMVKLKLMKLPQ